MKIQSTLIQSALFSFAILSCGLSNAKDAPANNGGTEEAAPEAERSDDASRIVNGHKFIDLGLPSKLLWAETNMGAETAADVGIYFAWGETEMKQKKSYDWETYKFGTSEDDMTKYNAKDEKEILDKEDDAAYVNWGPSCRIPDLDDFRELFDPDNCTWTWVETTNSSGSLIKVCKVTSVRNGNSIYLPQSGNYIGDTINHSDLTEEEAKFWSRNVDGYIIVPAFCFMIISDETSPQYLALISAHTSRQRKAQRKLLRWNSKTLSL